MINAECLPSGWASVPLRRVLTKGARAVRAGDEIVTAYRNGRVTTRASRRAEGYTVSESEYGYQGVRRGDFVFHALDGFAGAVGVSDADGKCTPVYHVCVPATGNDARFVAFVLRAMSYTGFLEQQAGSVRQRSIDFRTWESFARLEVPRPHPAQQRALADFLDDETARIDALIAKKRRMTRVLQERRAAHRERTYTELGDARGRLPLRRFVRCLDGRRIPLNQEERASRNGPYPYWGAGAIVDRLDAYLFDEELVLLGEDGAPFFDPLREVAFHVTEPVWVNNHIHVLQAGRGCSAAFLVEMLNAVDYGGSISGATRDKLTQEDMREIPLPNVDRRTQDEVVARARDAERQVSALTDRLTRQISLLQEHRQALITAAVTGELEIPGAAA